MPTITSKYSGTISLQSRWYMSYETFDDGSVLGTCKYGPYSGLQTITLSYSAIPSGQKVNSVILTATVSGGSVSNASSATVGAGATSATIGTQSLSAKTGTMRFATSVVSGKTSVSCLFCYSVYIPSASTGTGKYGSSGWNYSNITISNIVLTIIYGLDTSTGMCIGKDIKIGVNNIARTVKNIYVGVDGIAREAKTIWMGDLNGVARQIWPLNKMYPLNWWQLTYSSAATANPTQLVARYSSTASNKKAMLLLMPDLDKFNFDYCSVYMRYKGIASNSAASSFGNCYNDTFPVLKMTALSPASSAPLIKNISMTRSHGVDGTLVGINKSAQGIAGTTVEAFRFNKEDYLDLMLLDGTPSSGKIWLYCLNFDSAGYGQVIDMSSGYQPYILFHEADYDLKIIYRYYTSSKLSSTSNYLLCTSSTGSGLSSVSNVKSINVTVRFKMNVGTYSSSNTYTCQCKVGTYNGSSTSTWTDYCKMAVSDDTDHPALTTQRSLQFAISYDFTDATAIAGFANSTCYCWIRSSSGSSFYIPANTRIQVLVRAKY